MILGGGDGTTDLWNTTHGAGRRRQPGKLAFSGTGQRPRVVARRDAALPVGWIEGVGEIWLGKFASPATGNWSQTGTMTLQVGSNNLSTDYSGQDHRRQRHAPAV